MKVPWLTVGSAARRVVILRLKFHPSPTPCYHPTHPLSLCEGMLRARLWAKFALVSGNDELYGSVFKSFYVNIRPCAFGLTVMLIKIPNVTEIWVYFYFGTYLIILTLKNFTIRVSWVQNSGFWICIVLSVYGYSITANEPIYTS